MFYSSNNYKLLILVLSTSSFHIFFGIFKEILGGSGSVIAVFLAVASFRIFLVFLKKALEIQVQVQVQVLAW